MGKDATFTTNESGTPALAINHDYIKNTMYQLLFQRKNDAYSNRGIDLRQAIYKSVSDVQYMIPIIRNNMEKYTEFYPTQVEFRMYGEVLILLITLSYQNELINVTIDPETEIIGFLPL